MNAKLLLVDDHPMMLDALRQAMAQQPHLSVVGEASTGEAAVKLALELTPDLVVMDVHLLGMNGLEATRQILSVLPATKILIFSSTAGGAIVDEALQAGARGYIFKRGTVDELIRGLGEVMAGKLWLSPEVSGAIASVHESIQNGDTIADPLARSGIFPALVVNMVDVGEETGELDTMLYKVADTYDEEVAVLTDEQRVATDVLDGLRLQQPAPQPEPERRGWFLRKKPKEDMRMEPAPAPVQAPRATIAPRANAQVVAVASPNNAAAFAAKHGIPRHFSDYHDLLALPEVEVVLLGLPNTYHCQAACDAAAAKKHVICEKPLCPTLAEADRMIAACRDNGVHLMYAEELCFTPNTSAPSRSATRARWASCI